MAPKLLDDCFLHDRDRLRHDEALAILRDRIMPVTRIERIPTETALGRVLAADLAASRAVPPHTNAAVDGYAFAFSAYDRVAGSVFPIAGRAAAGHPLGHMSPADAAVRIFTGAVLPAPLDTIVMQEDVRIDGRPGAAVVHIPAGLKRGANVRLAGEDVQAGQQLFRAGDRLRPQDLAALASVGEAYLQCRARLRVGFVSSGDEVVRLGQRDLLLGEIYDANAPMLHALVAATGAEVIDLGVWPDNAGEVHARLAAAARDCDVIVTSGGASRGEEDHMVHAIERLGRRHMWQLAIKPGRPMSFGQIGDTVVLGLPGNPVAVLVCFLLYASPVLRRLGGGHWLEPRRYPLPATFAFESRKTGRREFWRGILDVRDGHMAVSKFERDGSGLISGLRVADGLIEIPEDVPEVKVGDLVSFIPFAEFGILR
jgi:molybdopterin molybdotransferase